MNMTMLQKTMMRTALVAVCATGLATVPMMAQDNAAPAPQQQDQAGAPQRGARGGPGREEHQVEFLTKKLSLTPDQVTQVKAIDDDSRTQALAVRNDASVAGPDKRAKMGDIHKAAQDKIRAVLTDDQKTKYDALQAEMQSRRQGREQRQDAPPAAPPQ